jgi:hypothetical protein
MTILHATCFQVSIWCKKRAWMQQLKRLMLDINILASGKTYDLKIKVCMF